MAGAVTWEAVTEFMASPPSRTRKEMPMQSLESRRKPQKPRVALISCTAAPPSSRPIVEVGRPCLPVTAAKLARATASCARPMRKRVTRSALVTTRTPISLVTQPSCTRSSTVMVASSPPMAQRYDCSPPSKSPPPVTLVRLVAPPPPETASERSTHFSSSRFCSRYFSRSRSQCRSRNEPSSAPSTKA